MPRGFYPHRASIWRRVPAGKTAFAEVLAPWALVAEDVPFDLQLRAGDVDQHQHGREGTGAWATFAPHGTDLRADDGILIDESTIPGMVGRRFEATGTMDWGRRGGMQGSADESREDFGHEPPQS
jgi:hypothetical protein